MYKMSIAKKIYFSPLGYAISAAQRILSHFVPRMMVYGYRNKIQKKFFRGTRISSSAYITEPSKLDIGDNVWVNHNVRLDASGGLKIGDGCTIGYGSMILTHSSHMAGRLNGAEFIKMRIEDRVGYIRKPVEIGEYTFIGGGAAVMPGVKIGRGCVIGVNSVVTKDVPDHAIVVGSPAKVIGSTVDTDKAFFDDPMVREYYYDKSLMEKEMSCATGK